MQKIEKFILVDRSGETHGYFHDDFSSAKDLADARGFAVDKYTFEFSVSELVYTPDGSPRWPHTNEDQEAVPRIKTVYQVVKDEGASHSYLLGGPWDSRSLAGEAMDAARAQGWDDRGFVIEPREIKVWPAEEEEPA